MRMIRTYVQKIKYAYHTFRSTVMANKSEILYTLHSDTMHECNTTLSRHVVGLIAHNAVIIKIQCNDNKMTTKNDSVRFTYETYAKLTYVKIRTYASKIKYAPYVRIELWRQHRLLCRVLHCVPKKTTLKLHTIDSTHAHQPISVIFGRGVAERVCY